VRVRTQTGELLNGNKPFYIPHPKTRNPQQYQMTQKKLLLNKADKLRCKVNDNSK